LYYCNLCLFHRTSFCWKLCSDTNSNNLFYCIYLFIYFLRGRRIHEWQGHIKHIMCSTWRKAAASKYWNLNPAITSPMWYRHESDVIPARVRCDTDSLNFCAKYFFHIVTKLKYIYFTQERTIDIMVCCN